MKYILFLLLSLTLSPVCAQRVTPRLHLVKGETYYMKSTGTSAITQSIHGRENKINVALAFNIAFKVTGIADTVYNMDVTYQNIDMKIHMADTTIDMNSAKKNISGEKTGKADTASMLVAAVTGRIFRIALSAKGKVLRVENLDNIITEIFKDFPQIDPAKKEQIKSKFIQSFGESAFKGRLEMGTAIFPNKTVSKNDRWTTNTTISVPAKAGVQTNYQLMDITGDFLQIHGDGVISNDKEAKSEEINGMPVKYNVTGGMTTDIKIDKKTGWITQLNLKQLIEGDIEIMDNPKMPGGMTIPLMVTADVFITDN